MLLNGIQGIIKWAIEVLKVWFLIGKQENQNFGSVFLRYLIIASLSLVDKAFKIQPNFHGIQYKAFLHQTRKEQWKWYVKEHNTLTLTRVEWYFLYFIEITRCCWGHIFDCLSFPFCPLNNGLLPWLPFQHCIHRWGIHVTQFLHGNPKLAFFLRFNICLVDILHIICNNNRTHLLFSGQGKKKFRK